ncbi:MAG TPA: PLDc N-terminal domain-containing protein [Ktedonobacteraceae bacterium]|nr:PLDc N-terminal domain-containing protein [Ktedonobacteraceae bacterium]
MFSGNLGSYIAAAGFAFWIWMIYECATKEPANDNNKIVWLLIIILTNIIGALLYFFIRRPERIRTVGR